MPKVKKITDKILQDIIELIRNGHSHKTAYQWAEITKDRFYNLMNKNPEFSRDVKKAEAYAIIDQVKIIKEYAAVKKDWKPLVVLLGKVYKTEFGDVKSLEVSGKLEHLSRVSDKELDDKIGEVFTAYLEGFSAGRSGTSSRKNKARRTEEQPDLSCPDTIPSEILEEAARNNKLGIPVSQNDS